MCTVCIIYVEYVYLKYTAMTNLSSKAGHNLITIKYCNFIFIKLKVT